jgi:hypothetical protein
LEGTWTGTQQSKPIPLKDIVEEAGLLDDPELLAELLGVEDPVLLLMMTPEMIDVIIKDINVTITVKATITFAAYDYDTGTMSGTTSTTVTFSGGNTALLWPYIMAMYEEMLPPDVITDIKPNDENHSLTMDNEVPPTEITVADFKGTQINQTGTKLRTKIAPNELGELGPWGSLVPSEVTLTRVK